MDWNKIKAEYIAGGTSYRKLAEKYGISRSKLQARATRERWVALQGQVKAKTESKIVNSVSDKSAKIDDKYFRLVDKLFDRAEEVIDKTPVWQISSIKDMATALKYLKECKGIKSDADIKEQDARIKKLLKDAERVDDGGITEIEVTFSAGEEAWNE